MSNTRLLKLKNDFDLEKLKELGFADDGKWFYVYNIRNTAEETVDIKVCKDTRVIDIQWQTLGGIRSFTIQLGIIYDLIKLGVVEKIIE